MTGKAGRKITKRHSQPQVFGTPENNAIRVAMASGEDEAACEEHIRHECELIQSDWSETERSVRAGKRRLEVGFTVPQVEVHHKSVRHLVWSAIE